MLVDEKVAWHHGDLTLIFLMKPGMFFTMTQMGISLIDIDWFMISSTQYLGFTIGTIGIPSKPAIRRNCPIDVFTVFMYLYSTCI